MYNRYIPEDVSYTRTETPPLRPQGPGRAPRQPVRFPDFLSGKDSKESLSNLLRSFHLENIDAGDVLLLLIMLYLLVEGDDLELVIALGLTLLMGLGEEPEA